MIEHIRSVDALKVLGFLFIPFENIGLKDKDEDLYLDMNSIL